MGHHPVSKILILLGSSVIWLGCSQPNMPTGLFPSLQAQSLAPISMEEINQLFRAGQYPEAIEKAEALLEHQETNGATDDSQLMPLLNMLGILHKAMGNWEVAEGYYERLLNESNWEASDPDGFQQAVVSHNLAELYREQAKYEQAEPLYAEALDTLMPLLGDMDRNVLVVRNNQAEFYRDIGDLEQAARLHQGIAQDREAALGPEHSDVGTSWYNLASIYRRQGQLDQSAELAQQAYDVKVNAYGDNHPDVASSLNLLGLIYQDQGNLEAAATALETALEIRQQLWGANHPLIAHLLNNLGTLAYAQNDMSQAQEYLDQALSMAQETLGEDHPNTQKIQENQQVISVSPESSEGLSTADLHVFGQ
ncbi:tetratricopeptide repeat protein [Adonisia turfae]|uniref:Tetratricopeptide repeat protein n=1 Tax=Adonisia turfae CCMR0081 TaxID=2292702 RepID=A0A6M0RLQ8_9CYAN|nr:tetratricopeptide repeat protein [Adonisia turfae]NEZ57165.1 tetratricopeptide repeat protein [Adonisia turfae CCMR0081]